MLWLLPVFTLVFVALVRATAVKVVPQNVRPLGDPEIDAFAPFTHFASAAYCDPSTIRTWSCGAHCQATPHFQLIATGGDGSDTLSWYVGYYPIMKTIIIAHQGTDPNELFSSLTGANVVLVPLDFPGIPPYVAAHMGFVYEQARTAEKILSVVERTLSIYSDSSVTIVGHSLNGAVALLDGLYLLRRSIVDSKSVRVISYGMPRVGNQAFANYVDGLSSDLSLFMLRGFVTHVNNREDPIPTMPDMLLGYHHSSGEVHIQDSGEWDACYGQDNPSKLCIVGDVNNIFKGNLSDHNAPYAGITMGC